MDHLKKDRVTNENRKKIGKKEQVKGQEKRSFGIFFKNTMQSNPHQEEMQKCKWKNAQVSSVAYNMVL